MLRKIKEVKSFETMKDCIKYYCLCRLLEIPGFQNLDIELDQFGTYSKLIDGITVDLIDDGAIKAFVSVEGRLIDISDKFEKFRQKIKSMG